MAVLLGSVTTMPKCPVVAMDVALMHDGRIIAVTYGMPQFYAIFTPSMDGTYETGTWSTPKMVGNWSKLGAMLSPTKDGMIVSAGGHLQYGDRLTTDRYDPTTDTWAAVAPADDLGDHQNGGGGPIYFPNGTLKRAPGYTSSTWSGSEGGWAHTPNHRMVQAAAWLDGSRGLRIADFSGNAMPTSSTQLSLNGVTNNAAPEKSYGGWDYVVNDETVCSIYMPGVDRVAVIHSRTGEILLVNHNGTNTATALSTAITKRWKRPSNNTPAIQLDAVHNGQTLEALRSGGKLKFTFVVSTPVFLTWALDGEFSLFVETSNNAHVRVGMRSLTLTIDGTPVTDSLLPTVANFDPSNSTLRTGVYEVTGTLLLSGAPGATTTTTIKNGAYGYIGGLDEMHSYESVAMIAPNGHLMYVSSSYGAGVCVGYWDGTTNDPAWITTNGDFGSIGANPGRYPFLWLPTGQLACIQATSGPQLWNPPTSWAPPSNYKPTLTSNPTALSQNSQVSVTGTRMFGRSVGCHQGDDESGICNHPIVSLRSKASGRVYYCRTYDWSAWSIAENASTSHTVSILDMPGGEYEMRVASAGAISDPVDVTVRASLGGGITVNQYR